MDRSYTVTGHILIFYFTILYLPKYFNCLNLDNATCVKGLLVCSFKSNSIFLLIIPLIDVDLWVNFISSQLLCDSFIHSLMSSSLLGLALAKYSMPVFICEQLLIFQTSLIGFADLILAVLVIVELCKSWDMGKAFKFRGSKMLPCQLFGRDSWEGHHHHPQRSMKVLVHWKCYTFPLPYLIVS